MWTLRADSNFKLDMPHFYLAEPGFQVEVVRERLRLVRDDEVCYEAPLAHCDGLVAFGHVEVRRSALDALLAKGAVIAFLALFGNLIGYAWPPMDRAVERRLILARAVLHPARRLAIARRLCERKLDAMEKVASQRLWNRPDAGTLAQVRAIRACAIETRAAPTLDALRGLEGIGTRRYYRTLEAQLLPPFEFAPAPVAPQGSIQRSPAAGGGM
jgi:CRISPR-associated protein Cas1